MLPLPLALTRVLDLSRSVAGAAGSRHLADFGAEVIVLERPGEGAAEPRQLLRNKLSCVLDATTDEGAALVLRLAVTADVVLLDEEDEGLAFGFEELKGAREDIIAVVVGEGGARQGMGAIVAAATLTALFQHRYAGIGQEVKVEFPLSRASLSALQVVAAGTGLRDATPDLPVSGIYRCKDGHVAVAVRSLSELAALGEVLGRPELVDAVSGGVELQAPLTQWAMQQGAADAAYALVEAGVAAQELLTAAGLVANEHLLARGFFEPVAAGETVADQDGVRIHFGDTPAHIRLPPPWPGEHDGYVLRGLLGLGDAEIERLAAAGVAGLGASGPQ